MTDTADRYIRSHELLSRDTARLLIVDVQQKLTPAIPVAKKMIGNCRRLIRAANLFEVPTFATEQYPQGLGPTVPELAELLDEIPDKQRFSSAEVLDWQPGESDDRDRVVVAGIEAHVCVFQTAVDLLSQGFRVYVPADAVASRHKLDWQTALQRLASSGAVVTTTESVMFEWCETSADPQFKQISQLIREFDE